MTTVLKILNRPPVDPIDGLFYWTRWGYGFEEYYGWDLPVPHRFVGTSDANYDYSIASGRIVDETDHCCPSCDRFLYSTNIQCLLENINPLSDFETLEIDDRFCVVQEVAKQAIVGAGISGLNFSPVYYPDKPNYYWLMQPIHNVAPAPIRYTQDCCGVCGSADVQCSVCHNFYTSCRVCGNTFNADPSDDKEWCPLELRDWNGDDAFGCLGYIVVTGECLEKLLKIGLFAFSFISCRVEREQITTFPGGEARLKNFIRHFDIP